MTAADQVQQLAAHLLPNNPCHRAPPPRTCFDIQARTPRRQLVFNPRSMCAACQLRWHLAEAHSLATQQARGAA